eukprot:g304.t1
MSTADGWATKSAAFTAASIARGEVSSTELVNYYISRIEALDDDVNAVVVRTFDQARKRAKLADQAWANGENWGPLHGLPITIKEAFWQTDTLSTCAVAECIDFIATSNAPAVQKLIDAGAIILGKTNLPVGAADVQSYNEKYGVTSNPWDLSRIPGGSSGGSAAAIAAGFSALELGSDIGGSIRNPAHFCGVCGHKPTQGIVSLAGHSPGTNHPAFEPLPLPLGFRTDPTFGHGLAVAGPLARTCADLELSMRVLSGPEPYQEQNGWSFTLPAAAVTEVGALRVACWLDDPFCPVEQECVSLMRTAADALQSAGAAVDFDARPSFDFAKQFADYEKMLWAQMTPQEQPMTYLEFIGLTGKRWRYKQIWLDFFERFDVMLCPIMPCTAFEHQNQVPIEERQIEINGRATDYFPTLIKWAGLVIFSDLPSTVVPVGLDSHGMPFGVQIVSAPWRDLQCIEVGKALERLGFGYRAPPQFDDSQGSRSSSGGGSSSSRARL